jgi:hypothetical protein
MRSKHVEPDALAVDLRKDVADLVEGEITVELDVGDLVLLGDPFEVLAERLGIVRALHRGFGDVDLTAFVSSCRLVTPMLLVTLHPVRKLPAAAADDGKGEHVRLVLGRRVRQEVQAAARPVVMKGLVVRHLHEALDLDEVEVAIRTVRCSDVRRDERVVHRGEALLAVEDDVLGAAIGAVKAVDGLAREIPKVV